METPSSSTRRVTRSQSMATVNNNIPPISRKIEDSEKGYSKSRKKDRSALVEITNDSPIVGLATGSRETPSSGLAKRRTFRGKDDGTPGSGEILLRGQVKTLLQKVEEEAVLSKLPLENRPFLHLVNSPSRLLAPTPANTPLILNLSGLDSINPSPVTHEQLISQVVVINDIIDEKKEESIEYEKNLTRSLLLDFSEKLELSNSSECSSVVTVHGGPESSKEKSSSTPDDDTSSIWSIQVNASSNNTHDEDDDEEEGLLDEEERGLFDELCKGVSRIKVNTTTAKFAGKHTRFMYNNSDDDEVVEECDGGLLSPSVLRLQGLPTPKGKHLRFRTEEEEGSE